MTVMRDCFPEVRHTMGGKSIVRSGPQHSGVWATAPWSAMIPFGLG